MHYCCPTTTKLLGSNAPARLPTTPANSRPKARGDNKRKSTVLTHAVPISDLLEEIDLVQYIQQDGGNKLGRVLKVLPSEDILLEPLKKDEEEEEPIFVQDENVEPEPIPQSNLLRILQDYEFEYSQRQSKEDNPHGEHAEDIYKILKPLNWDLKQH
mmetsp:Transcript_22173/g.61325  ORF Transcript_22173/g.61325 Transcript_22173/m.61325 type:complete len:157 (-) Transcript_22173:67-537(-)